MDALRVELLKNTYLLATARHRFNIAKDILEHVLFTLPKQQAASDAIPEKTPEVAFAEGVAALENEADRLAIEAWGTDWMRQVRVSNFNAQVDSMQAWISSLPVLKLYLPRLLDEPGYQIIGEWCRGELHQQTMLTVEVDPELIGGCAFVRDDLYHEYSLRKALDADPDLIPDVFKEYANA